MCSTVPKTKKITISLSAEILKEVEELEKKVKNPPAPRVDSLLAGRVGIRIKQRFV
ncbi:MAG: hypothetical protein E3K37_06400 [Candidatus Kuenenia sp.]|nr:hypothetical protein [Candidatus Kuenenia hertensis]